MMEDRKLLCLPSSLPWECQRPISSSWRDLISPGEHVDVVSNKLRCDSHRDTSCSDGYASNGAALSWYRL